MGGKDNKRSSGGHQMCDQFDHMIESFNSENIISGGTITNISNISDCLEMHA